MLHNNRCDCGGPRLCLGCPIVFIIHFLFILLAWFRFAILDALEPLSSWIIIEETGEVCCTRCNCKAGLGGKCTHIAAVLFYLKTATIVQGIKLVHNLSGNGHAVI